MTSGPARTFYTILGVSPRATAAEIRVAYLNLARALHPDRARTGSDAERSLAERRMREVNEAYETLGDAAKRAAYDRAASPPQRAPGPSAASRPPAAPRPRPTGNPERFDADPFARDDDGRWPHDPEDDIELSPVVAFLLHRGPLIAVLLLAAFLFVATAYAGGGGSDDADPSIPTTTCVGIPSTVVVGGSAVELPC